MAKCQGCGAPIMFVKTAAGKMMPVNVKPVRYVRNPFGLGRIITGDGVSVACDIVGEGRENASRGMLPHWATRKNPPQPRRMKRPPPKPEELKKKPQATAQEPDVVQEKFW